MHEELQIDLHVNYVKDLFRHPSYLVHFMADHLKMNALYWGLGTTKNYIFSFFFILFFFLLVPIFFSLLVGFFPLVF